MKIKKVDIRGFHNVEGVKSYEFGDMTYLHGPNGAGKSTVLQAIQLCLLGHVPGFNKTKPAIMSHANGDGMEIALTFDDGDGGEFQVIRKFKKSGSKITDDVKCTSSKYTVDAIVGDASLPIFNWGEFMDLTANKMKAWFIKFLPSDSGGVDWEYELYGSIPDGARVPDGMVEEYLGKISEMDGKSAVESASDVNAMLKDDLSFSKALLDEKAKSINAFIKYSDSDMGLDADELRDEIDLVRCEREYCADQLVELGEVIGEYEEAEKHNAGISGKIDALSVDVLSDDEYKSMKSELDDLMSAKRKLQDEYDAEVHGRVDGHIVLSGISDKMVPIRAKMQAIEDLLKSKDTCPYTGDKCGTIPKSKADARKRYDELAAELAGLESERKGKAAEFEERQGKVASMADKLFDYRKRADFLKARLEKSDEVSARIEDLKSQYDDSVGDDGYADATREYDRIAARQNELADKMAELSKMESAVKYSGMIDALIKEKADLEDKIEILKAWIHHTGENGLQTSLMMRPFEAMEDGVGRHLSKMFDDGCKCKFQMSNSANSFSFGLERGGRYIPYKMLSTGERTLYTFALMLYLSGNSKSPLHIVMIDDFLDHLDDSRLDALFDILSSGDWLGGTQIIMAGVRPCKSDNVQIIEVQDASHGADDM